MRGKLSLGMKFTLRLLLVLLVGGIISGVALSLQLEKMAQEAVTANVMTLLSSMGAVRSYTAAQIGPLLEPMMTAEHTFFP